jgi:hypothetical protein
MEKIFVATPLYNGLISHMYMRGALQAQKEMLGNIKFSTAVGTYLVINRETLLKRFLVAEEYTHILYVDSDIGWGYQSLRMLLDVDTDFISGIYLKRAGDHGIPIEMVKDAKPICNGKVYECLTVPAGFLLLKRRCVQEMANFYHPTWTMDFQHGKYVGEDINFCQKWRQIGGQIWAHSQVILDHVGEVIFNPTKGAAIEEEG